jgi:NAD(P)H-dependent flavin oxidoreductase YrpB (nitropropane dioxygenase family)
MASCARWKAVPSRYLTGWEGARREAEQLRDEVLSAIRGRTTHEVLPFSGQTAGLVHDILPVKEIVERMVAEAELALTREDVFRGLRG